MNEYTNESCLQPLLKKFVLRALCRSLSFVCIFWTELSFWQFHVSLSACFFGPFAGPSSGMFMKHQLFYYLLSPLNVLDWVKKSSILFVFFLACTCCTKCFTMCFFEYVYFYCLGFCICLFVCLFSYSLFYGPAALFFSHPTGGKVSFKQL